jgi:hypothetical protein
MYLWTCGSFKSANHKQFGAQLRMRKVPHLSKVRKSIKLFKSANLRICELLCGPPAFGFKDSHTSLTWAVSTLSRKKQCRTCMQKIIVQHPVHCTEDMAEKGLGLVACCVDVCCVPFL